MNICNEKLISRGRNDLYDRAWIMELDMDFKWIIIRAYKGPLTPLNNPLIHLKSMSSTLIQALSNLSILLGDLEMTG